MSRFRSAPIPGSERVAANGIELCYESVGDPAWPVILLVMGLGTQMIAWPDAFVSGLVERGFRVIRFDNRDIGKSTWLSGARVPNPVWILTAMRFGLRPAAPYTLTDMARDAIGLLDALNVEKAHIVGASMGGMIAQIIAATAPERTLSLTSIMSSSGARGLPGPSPQIRRRMLRRRPGDMTRDQIIADSADGLRMMSYPDPARAPDAYRDLATRAYDRGYNPGGMRRQLAAIIADGSRVSRLKRIAAPTLVIHGAADPLVPAINGEDTARHIAGARFALIEPMGHDLPPSQIPRLVELIAGHAAAA
jgi:proline iminopeptidase